MLLENNFNFNEIYEHHSWSGENILAACGNAEDANSPVYLMVLSHRDLFIPLQSIKNRPTGDPREWTKIYLVRRCISVWVESRLLRINSCVLTEDF